MSSEMIAEEDPSEEKAKSIEAMSRSKKNNINFGPRPGPNTVDPMPVNMGQGSSQRANFDVIDTPSPRIDHKDLESDSKQQSLEEIKSAVSNLSNPKSEEDSGTVKTLKQYDESDFSLRHKLSNKLHQGSTGFDERDMTTNINAKSEYTDKVEEINLIQDGSKKKFKVSNNAKRNSLKANFIN